jgi:pimeloyl-ACP methyl ester carboxylesterase
MAWTALYLVAGAVILTVGVFLLSAFVYERIAGWHDRRQLQPPGKMIEVSGYKLHLLCDGTGPPTVWIAPGGGSAAITWEVIQGQVARFSNVCCYDRAGIGWSENTSEPCTLKQRVIELHTLLANTGKRPPYVLVGHSYSGLFIRVFARDHLDEVAGMVLVDSTEEQFISGPEFLKMWKAARPLVTRRALASSFGGMRLWLRWHPSEAALPQNFSVEAREAHRTFVSGRKYWKTAFDEMRSLTSANERRFLSDQKNFGRLGDIPLVVIRRGKGIPVDAPQLRYPGAMTASEFDRLEIEAQQRLVRLSTNSELVVAEKSGHAINFEQPELVVDAIRRVVEAARTGKRLTQVS